MRLVKRSFLVGWLIRNCGYIFILCIVVAFLQAGLYSAHQAHHVEVLPSVDEWLSDENGVSFQDSRKKSAVGDHPIKALMENAEERYKKKVNSQSATLRAAVAEYKRRYGRPPPKGFDKWWAFAKKYDVIMLDEYDAIVEDLEPFWELSGKELRRRTQQVGELPSIDLVRVRKGNLSVVNMEHGFEDSEVSARAGGFSAMLGKFAHLLPDMDFPINAKAEGRVLVPWEHRKYPNLTLQDSSAGIESMLGGPFRPDWDDTGNVWEAWRRTCDPKSSARRLFSSLRNATAMQTNNYLSSATSSPGGDFSFTATTASSVDYCHKPYAHYTQGHFFSDWRSIPALYPVFSPAKARGFLDVRIPSHYYYGSTKRYTYGWDSVNLELKDVDPMEIPWEKKEDKIFWRGATTGGGSHPPGFAPQYQRHRFLRMSSDSSSATRRVTFPDPPDSTNYMTSPVPVARMNTEIMDAAFVKAVSPGGYPGGIKALEADHRFADSVLLGKHWSYKYLVDFDGMSYSGRFMSFLASDSVPVKATVYDEFFSDWIEPWVHFIPLSSSYQEIYNIFAYFSGPTHSMLEAVNSTSLALSGETRKSINGDRRLRRIARAGKQWKKTIGRTIDMEVYVYRLCLEWARLLADDRTSMSF